MATVKVTEELIIKYHNKQFQKIQAIKQNKLKRVNKVIDII